MNTPNAPDSTKPDDDRRGADLSGTPVFVTNVSSMPVGLAPIVALNGGSSRRAAVELLDENADEHPKCKRFKAELSVAEGLEKIASMDIDRSTSEASSVHLATEGVKNDCVLPVDMVCRLPAEVLLNILHCVDFSTLVALSFTGHAFHHCVRANANVLAKRRRMQVVVEDRKVILVNGEDLIQHEVGWDLDNPRYYVEALRDLAPLLGLHSLTSLRVRIDFRRLPILLCLDAALALRFIETLDIWIDSMMTSAITSVEDLNLFTGQFPRLRQLRLYARGKPIFDWSAFLRSEGALRLPELVARLQGVFQTTEHRSSVPPEFDFLRYCFDCSLLAAGVATYVYMPSHLKLSRSFLVASLRRIAKADRTITVQFGMVGEPHLSTEKFSLDHLPHDYRTIIHYKSRTSAISVYQQQGRITVTNDPTFDPFDRI